MTEVPLLYEVGAEDRFDKVVAITAPRLLREQRTNVPMEGREERLIDDREKVKRADYAYVNTGGIAELDAWVAGVMEELRAAASLRRSDDVAFRRSPAQGAVEDRPRILWIGYSATSTAASGPSKLP